MTEQEWLECTNPLPMMEYLRDKASDRKFRSFACACCRRIWHLFKDKRCGLFVESAEQFADGLKTDGELASIRSLAASCLTYTGGDVMTTEDFATFAAEGVTFPAGGDFNAYRAADSVSSMTLGAVACESGLHVPLGAFQAYAASNFEASAASKAEAIEYTRLLKEIFGNPFRPVTIDPRWLTSSVVDLATAIYEERAFERMPILADALTDSGCDNEEIVAHCRGAEPHVRGCWVVDKLLGKE